ncbi:MAG: type II toxin-antitoxin system HipA family toxin [Spirochaetes bacterium]|nr:MAG: type II toxin-antitoxin system HipA family toxin [Spirochaetota bacterium]
MNICPIIYQPCGEEKYSQKGLSLLSKNLTRLNDFPYTQEEQLHEAAMRADKMSIQGVQPKLSARLATKGEIFTIADRGGEYILKPENSFYPELPANESLTMKLAQSAGIETPLNGMIYSLDGRLTYFIKRFDRYGKGKKLSIEDFAQLAGRSRETKYDYSMENLAGLLDRFCTFPVIEKVKLLRLTLFNFLTGNEDMHLKNFSVILREGKVELSPAYDLLNTTIALKDAKAEIALPIDGKKNNLTRQALINYFAKERLGINNTVIARELKYLETAWCGWEKLVSISFLSAQMKQRYIEMIRHRGERIGFLKIHGIPFPL